MAVAAALCGVLTGCNTAQPPVDDETAVLGPARCPAGILMGAGTSTQRAAIDEVGEAYAERCASRASVRYNPVGTQGGLAAFAEGDVEWAGIDIPFNEQQRRDAAESCSAGDVWSLPMVAGPVAIAYNIEGVEELTLSAEVLGRILDGRIARWDDPAVAALNAEVTLPKAPITVVARNDLTGVNSELTHYLATAGDWPADRVGDGWAGGGERRNETPGVVSELRGTPNSVGYVEWSAARDNDLAVARLDSGAGPVELTPQSAAAGLAAAEVSGTGPGVRLVPRYSDPEPGAYPLQVVSYEVVCSAGATPSPQVTLLRDFLGFLASDPQQESLGAMGFTPLPGEVRESVRETIGQIR